VKVVARRIEGYAHEIDLEGGHELVLDEPADRGGTDTGPRPTQLLASALAGCIAITMEMYAERKDWDLGRLEVDVEVSYEGTVPNDYEVSIKLPDGLDEEQRRRLLVIATKCPVHRVLAGEAQVRVREHLEAD
jgi:putative redox protein